MKKAVGGELVRTTLNQGVRGSSPRWRTIEYRLNIAFKRYFFNFLHNAQIGINHTF